MYFIDLIQFKLSCYKKYKKLNENYIDNDIYMIEIEIN